MGYTAVFTKAPQAILDYSISWADTKPDGVLISVSDWVLPVALTEISKAINGDTTEVIISGGLENVAYTAVNTITYDNGQVDERQITIKVAKRRKQFVKRAAAILDYWIDWTAAKPTGLTVQSSVWTLDAALSNQGDGIISADDLTYCVISGGTGNEVYEALNVITYSDGVRKDARIIELKII